MKRINIMKKIMSYCGRKKVIRQKFKENDRFCIKVVFLLTFLSFEMLFLSSFILFCVKTHPNLHHALLTLITEKCVFYRKRSKALPAT